MDRRDNGDKIQMQAFIKSDRCQNRQGNTSKQLYPGQGKSNPIQAMTRAGSKQSQETMKQSKVQNTGKARQGKNKAR